MPILDMFQEQIDVTPELNNKQLKKISEFVIENSGLKLEGKVEDNIDEFKKYLIKILSDKDMTEFLKFDDTQQFLILSFYKYLTNLEEKNNNNKNETKKIELEKEEKMTQDKLVKEILKLNNKKVIKELFLKLDIYGLEIIFEKKYNEGRNGNNRIDSAKLFGKKLFENININILVDVFYDRLFENNNNNSFFNKILKSNSGLNRAGEIKILVELDIKSYFKYKDIIINRVNIDIVNYYNYILGYIKSNIQKENIENGFNQYILTNPNKNGQPVFTKKQKNK